MGVQVLFFDLDDTLFDTRGCSEAALAVTGALARECCPELGEEQLRATYHAVIREVDGLLAGGQLAFKTAQALHLHRWHGILARCGADTGHAPLLAERYRLTRREHYRLFDDVPEVLSRLDGHRAALLTNGPGEMQREKIAAVGLEHWLSGVYISGELGVWKPHPEIFRHALNGMACAAEDAVMVGDSLANDIAGAAALGMRTVWVNRYGFALPPEIRPDAVIEDLRGLPELLSRSEDAGASWA
jgi:putative hydrolase of the HAD superfamily